MSDPKTRAGDRIQKILARAGVSSRREAEELITEGRVTVNGQPAELGQKADPEHDSIKLDGKRIVLPKEHRYLLLNKPRGVMTTVSDPGGRPTVIDLVPPGLRKALVPVGRLDFLTEGLLLLTDDGDFAHRVAHPRYGCRKTYEVKVLGRPAERDLDRLREGIVLDGERTAPCRIEHRSVSRPKGVDSDNTWWNVELSQGRTRQIREMFQRIGHPVAKLRRVAIGSLSDPNLPLGAIRELTPREVETLRQGSRPSDPLPRLAGGKTPGGKTQAPTGTSERFPEIRRWRPKGEEKAADAPRPPRAARPPQSFEDEPRRRPESREARPERISRTVRLPSAEEVRPAAPRRAGTASRPAGEERGGRPAPRPPRSMPQASREAEGRGDFDFEAESTSYARRARVPQGVRSPRREEGGGRPPRPAVAAPRAPRSRTAPYPPPVIEREERGRSAGRPASRSAGPSAGRSSDRPVSGRPAAPGRGKERVGGTPTGRPGSPRSAGGGGSARPGGKGPGSNRSGSGRPAPDRSGPRSGARPGGPGGRPGSRPGRPGSPGGRSGGRKGR